MCTSNNIIALFRHSKTICNYHQTPKGRSFGRRNERPPRPCEDNGAPTFTSYRALCHLDPGAIVGLGASQSVVGLATLKDAGAACGFDTASTKPPVQATHCFGDNPEAMGTLFSVSVPFHARANNRQNGDDPSVKFFVTSSLLSSS